MHILYVSANECTHGGMEWESTARRTAGDRASLVDFDDAPFPASGPACHCLSVLPDVPDAVRGLVYRRQVKTFDPHPSSLAARLSGLGRTHFVVAPIRRLQTSTVVGTGDTILRAGVCVVLAVIYLAGAERRVHTWWGGWRALVPRSCGLDTIITDRAVSDTFGGRGGEYTPASLLPPSILPAGPARCEKLHDTVCLVWVGVRPILPAVCTCSQ